MVFSLSLGSLIKAGFQIFSFTLILSRLNIHVLLACDQVHVQMSVLWLVLVHVADAQLISSDLLKTQS